MFCCWSQEIRDLGLKIAERIYFSDWINIESMELRKAMLIIIQRANTSHGINVCGFFEISKETFTAVRIIY